VPTLAKILTLATAAALTASGAQAAIATLEDGNSRVHFDTINPGNRVGMDSWQVDGTEMLFNQWFWYRVGSAGPEQRINSLTEVNAGVFNSNFDPRPDTFTVLYGGVGFEMELSFRLQGGSAGSGVSDVAEQIRITNTGSTALPFHFFQYCDFDLLNDIQDDFVQILGGPQNTVQQGDAGYLTTETVVSPQPVRFEVNTYANTINRLDDASPDTLNGTAALGPPRADYTWAFEWEFLLAPGSSYIISKDKNIIPAPGTAALLALAGLGLARRRR
jgi:hypothetical protein